jgi:ribose transport system permease protein
MTIAMEVRPKRGETALRAVSRGAGPIVLLLLFVYFSITLPGTFLSLDNFRSMGAAQAVPGILALGLLFPLVAGEFDFSGGALASGAAVALAILTGEHGVNWAIACVIVILGGVAIGAVNGVLVGVFNYNSFVATLAVSGIVGGITLAVTQGSTLNSNIPSTFSRLGGQVFGIPLPIIYLLAVFGVVAYVLRQTAWGRHHEAIGKGRRAASLAGIRVRHHIIVAFMASGTVAVLAGILIVAYLGSAPPGEGQAYTLAAFAAVFLGSTMLRPTFFNASGTLIAIILIAVGVNGLSLAGAQSYVSQTFTGIVLLIAVGLSRLERLVSQ